MGFADMPNCKFGTPEALKFLIVIIIERDIHLSGKIAQCLHGIIKIISGNLFRQIFKQSRSFRVFGVIEVKVFSISPR